MAKSGRRLARRNRKSLNFRLANVPCLFVDTPPDIDDLAMLAEFAQLALARARAASARAEAIEIQGGDPSQHLVALDRMGRAMRLALSLRRRFMDEAEHNTGRRVQARKDALRAALKPAIRLHADFADRQDLDWSLAHRLETEADALANLSFEDGVLRLSRMLGLPDEIRLPEPDEDARGEGAECATDEDVEGDFADLLTPDLIDRACDIAARATGPP
jgi:hypothetical protein